MSSWERPSGFCIALLSGGGVGVAPPLVCRVEKCRTDLSESKKYHKRHRVCEYHDKAQVVMVDGLKQRFCQQCSRFHELPEFDEAKRSCRKRLEGHNARRRKNSMESRGEGSSRLPAKKEQCRSQMVYPKNSCGCRRIPSNLRGFLTEWV